MVEKFHIAGGQPHRTVPTLMSKEDRERRVKLILEEVQEFYESEGDIVKQVDGLIDTLYVTIGTLVEMGVRPYSLFRIVHEANMRKFPDGKAIVNADGKVLKPQGWYGPEREIEQELAMQALQYDSEWQEVFHRAGLDTAHITRVYAFDYDREPGWSWIAVVDYSEKPTIVLSDADGPIIGDNVHELVRENLSPEELRRLGYPTVADAGQSGNPEQG